MGIRQPNEFAGLGETVWFFGVVEDRQDPLNAGRVRVRCQGWHSPNREEVPMSDLPWSQALNTSQSASISGLGSSVTGMVEGTTVFGLFLDGRNAQHPFILGTVAGISAQGSGRGNRGFGDPNALYPIPSEVGFPDTPKLAYDRWTEDKITQDKDANRVTDIPTAQAPALSKTSRAPKIPAGQWSEPEQRGGTSSYPFNHVTQSEIGHAFEVDDTPGCERIHTYHKAGTFVEIQPDGSRVTKIVAKDYEIIVSDKNVMIAGDCNVTINGDARVLVKGDMIQEIKGDYRLSVHGSMRTKIAGNKEEEISSSRSQSIAKNDSLFVNKDRVQTIGGDASEVVKGTEILSASKIIITSAGSIDIGGSTLNLAAEDIVNSTDLTIHGVSTATDDHISGALSISGKNHTHTDSIGLGAGITTPPNP